MKGLFHLHVSGVPCNEARVWEDLATERGWSLEGQSEGGGDGIGDEIEAGSGTGGGDGTGGVSGYGYGYLKGDGIMNAQGGGYGGGHGDGQGDRSVAGPNSSGDGSEIWQHSEDEGRIV